ncbi:cytochrome c4 [Methyloligella sp. 2.7D]|uniref:c-type cytochrome n=1 Tax=unclassified Methyloligella TaxID=2625955 RepID=UPI00157C2311|nr:cytochrome c4 [Methyloligella sp. GL2]QKP78415.1 cytochrome c4 [Methyloligella sp. GL2]
MNLFARAMALALCLAAAFASGNLLAQEAPAKAAICAGCHGADGVPINKETPVIWGQNEGYLYLQLRDFKKGFRKNPIMEPIAAQLEKSDMQELAAYFTKQKWPNLGQPSAPDDVTKMAQTAASSIGCRGCHLDHFQGDGTTARLAGQSEEYLHKTMLAFRDGSRGNNPGMSDLMKSASKDDIAALAKYLAGLQIDAYLGNR